MNLECKNTWEASISTKKPKHLNWKADRLTFKNSLRMNHTLLRATRTPWMTSGIWAGKIVQSKVQEQKPGCDNLAKGLWEHTWLSQFSDGWILVSCHWKVWKFIRFYIITRQKRKTNKNPYNNIICDFEILTSCLVFHSVRRINRSKGHLCWKWIIKMLEEVLFKALTFVSYNISHLICSSGWR